jgi:hypothetical protein
LCVCVSTAVAKSGEEKREKCGVVAFTVVKLGQHRCIKPERRADEEAAEKVRELHEKKKNIWARTHTHTDK